MLMLMLGLGPGPHPHSCSGDEHPLDTQPRRDIEEKGERQGLPPREEHHPPEEIVVETGSKEGHPDHITIQGSKQS